MLRAESSELRSVWRLAAPAIAQQLLHTAVFLVDRAMLGHFDADSLASMQISNPFVWSVFSLLSAFTVGSVAFVGRSIGGGRAVEASAGLRASAVLAIGLGLVVTALGPLAIPLVTEGLFPAASAPVQAESAAYLGVALRTMPFTLLSFTLAVCLQAAGDTRTPFAVAAVGNLVNVVLTWALVFGRLGLPSLGARGAAIGSALAFAWETVALLALLSSPTLRLSWRGRGGERDALRRMLRVSVASLGERALQHTGFLGFVAMIGTLGPAAMAANQALISIESVVFLSADGFGIAAAALVAQRLGAGRADEAAAAGRAATKLTVIVLGGVGVVFALFGSLLMRGFTSDPSIVALGAPCLYVAAVAAPLMGAGVVLSEALRGAGATREALGITFLGGLLVRLGVTGVIVFVWDGGLLGVWIGSTIDWAVRAALGRHVFARGRWKTAQV
ncbi:MAG: MATE family efflux transporter [Myxococcales bacterium]|nr:MATE family efflux transporter [Myxococcales bacterium]